MDLVAYALAKKKAKEYTDQAIAAIGKGITYKGAVSYYADLPANASEGDAYTVLYEGTSGTVASGAEYVWGNLSGVNQWVEIGRETPMKVKSYGTVLTPDANGYVNIPQADPYTAGVIKTNDNYGTYASGGVLYASSKSVTGYEYGPNNMFIGKGTLDTLISSRGWCSGIKTTMDAVAVSGAKYVLGELSSLSITMPTNVAVGKEIIVIFSSGVTPCSLTCSMTGFSFVPKANKTNKLVFTLVHKADAQIVGDVDKWIAETEEF